MQNHGKNFQTNLGIPHAMVPHLFAMHTVEVSQLLELIPCNHTNYLQTQQSSSRRE